MTLPFGNPASVVRDSVFYYVGPCQPQVWCWINIAPHKLSLVSMSSLPSPAQHSQRAWTVCLWGILDFSKARRPKPASQTHKTSVSECRALGLCELHYGWKWNWQVKSRFSFKTMFVQLVDAESSKQYVGIHFPLWPLLSGSSFWQTL